MNNSGELRALIDIGEIREYNYDDFSNIKPIAKGGYGAVFSAIFKPKGITIALKKLSNLDSDKKEFVKEVRHLRKVDHHPYINQLLGITQGKRFNIIFEYLNLYQ
ncbi:35544_t:CDS:2 [Gigaspora margarita]|uniref:35544_t:CDS:1 n=1 Tax=Gigaspora margarita TaxID=4874 RepID=A0ABN7V5R7_GIGMA|nr:35544_t:CDS:2 [Gigaspora margarita]